jgi:predicted transcriptional regulator
MISKEPVLYNRQKYCILNFALNAGTVTSRDLTFNLKITSGNAWQRLSKMCLQGYLARNKRGVYRLAVKGIRVLKQLQERKNIECVTGEEISFN